MGKVSLRLVGAAFFVAAFSPAVAHAQEVQVIVGFHGAPDQAVFGRHGGHARTDLKALRACSGAVPPARLAALRREPGVAYVEEDQVRHPSLTPNDTYYSLQSGAFGLSSFPAAWDTSTGAGVRVAVLDTGCDTSHPDLAAKIQAKRNFTGGNVTDVSDKNGHGSHTAGTVGAITNNGRGVASAGYQCGLAIGKVLGSQGGYDSWIAAGLNWSWQSAGAKVVNMSLGGPGTSSTLENAVNAAWNNSVVVVAAAGNESTSAPSYPGAYANSIGVAATDSQGVLASFSNYGEVVDIAACGVNVASTYKRGGYVYMSGTSMSSPHVAGAAALVWASSFGTSQAAVRNQLIGTATQAVTGANAGSLKVLNAAAAVTTAAP